MSKFNLGWGNSVAVREAFLNTFNGNPVVFGPKDLMSMDYTEHEGDAEIVEITRKVIERQVGQTYKHVFLTHGATGGVTIALRAYQQSGKIDCHTRQAPYYVRYPSMIRAAGLNHLDESFHISRHDSVVLLDTPSNPLGLVNEITDTKGAPIVFDGVYFNNVYMTIKSPAPRHDIAVGSYSKLLGMNGIRIGWIAVNDDLISARIADLITAEYCGLSRSSSEIVKSTLQDFNWDSFEFSARMRLDYNREEWSKLEKFFGDVPVGINGMFYYGPTDEKCRQLLVKAGVHWTSGADLGTSEDYGRFNLGQDPVLLKAAVREILKIDQLRGQ